MTADFIQANYESLTAVALRFQAQADHMDQMAQRIGRDVHALQDGGWQGQGSQAFITETGGEVVPAISRLRQALIEAKQVVINCVDILQSAEEEAARLFAWKTDAIGGVKDTVGTSGDASVVPTPSGRAPSINQILENGKGNIAKVFNEQYMEDMIGHKETGADDSRLNQSMEDLLDMVRSGDRDMASVRPVLDRIADIRNVAPADLYHQYQNVFLPLWDNSPSKGTIDLNRHPSFMGSTPSLRYGQVVGDVFGIDPVFGAILHPTGGLVGPGDVSYQAGNNDAIGYHGIFHDAGGYLYNYQSGTGPGYDYLDREPFSTTSPLSGQIGGISWWAGHTGLDADVLPYVVPDLPYVPKFVERSLGNLIEDKPIAFLREGIFIYEGGANIAMGIDNVIRGDWMAGGDRVLEGADQIASGIIRNIWDGLSI